MKVSSYRASNPTGGWDRRKFQKTKKCKVAVVYDWERNAVTEKEIKFIEPSQQYLQPASSAKMVSEVLCILCQAGSNFSAQHQITKILISYLLLQRILTLRLTANVGHPLSKMQFHYLMFLDVFRKLCNSFNGNVEWISSVSFLFLVSQWGPRRLSRTATSSRL